MKFLEQLPPVDKNIVSVAPVSVIQPSAETPATTPENDIPEAPDKVTEPEPVQNNLPDEEISSDVEDEVSPVDDIAECTDDQQVEPESTAITSDVESVHREESHDAVEEDANITPCTISKTIEIVPVNDDENDEDDEDDYDDNDAEMLSAYIIPQRQVEEKPRESLTPDRLQHSIANEHPEELVNVVKRDAIVQETLDLFSGEVIDIHR